MSTQPDLQPVKRGPGRPRGRQEWKPRTALLTEEDEAMLVELAQDRGVSAAAMLRLLIRDAGRILRRRQRTEEMTQEDWDRTQEFYRTDPETRKWTGAGPPARHGEVTEG